MSEYRAGAVDTRFFAVFVGNVREEKLRSLLFSQGKHVEYLGSKNSMYLDFQVPFLE
jgi:hypothetical protein